MKKINYKFLLYLNDRIPIKHPQFDNSIKNFDNIMYEVNYNLQCIIKKCEIYWEEE